jgi:hypothetical protein
MDPTTSRLDFYLKVNDVQNFINRNTPSVLAQGAKAIVNALGGASIGGIVGKALPFIEEAYPGVLGTAPEYALSIVKPIFAEYLAPTIPSTNYIPIALAGFGGAIVFGFTFYRQRNLSAQVAVAKTALGPKPDKLVTDSDLVKLQNILPSLNVENSARGKLVVTDKEINKLVENKDRMSDAESVKITIKNTLSDLLTTDVNNDDERVQLYNFLKKCKIDDRTLLNQIYAESWDFTLEDKENVLRFINVNNIKTPGSDIKNSNSSIEKSGSEDEIYISKVDPRDFSSDQKISPEDFAKHPDIISLILETNILDVDTAVKTRNDNIPDYKRKNLGRLWNCPPITNNNCENIRNLLKDIDQEIYDLRAIEKTWNALNNNERDILLRLLASPKLDQKKVQGVVDIINKFPIVGEKQLQTSDNDELIDDDSSSPSEVNLSSSS